MKVRGDGGPFVVALSGQEFNMLVATGYLPVSVAMGVCVYHIARLGPRAVFRNLRITAELRAYTGALYEARELAMRRLQEEALKTGGEGVVGVTISESSHVWGTKTIEFFCMGTAIRRADGHGPYVPTADRGQSPPVMALSMRDTKTFSDPAALHRSDPRIGR